MSHIPKCGEPAANLDGGMALPEERERCKLDYRCDLENRTHW